MISSPAAGEKINGLSLEAPRTAAKESDLRSISQIGPNWVAIIPYGFIKQNSYQVQFDISRQWWGETAEGTEKQIQLAKTLGYKVLLKPQVWIQGDNYTGDFSPSNDEEWQELENSYRAYLKRYLSSETLLSVDALCIGTEWDHFAQQKPHYWESLIDDIRAIYSGPLTYATNWDTLEIPAIWQNVDAIGVNAYTPAGQWDEFQKELQSLSDRFNKPIVFTEYGFRSVRDTTSQPWEGANGRPTDQQAQYAALEKFYQTFWDQPYIIGGFLWKWHLKPGRNMEKGYTVQGKPAQALVRKIHHR
ncbi:MAG: hypothetical protein AAFY98_09480 [Verrucomicrobiota bacterium]